jgi:parvulin-like peptidyl-prolyl isomerase
VTAHHKILIAKLIEKEVDKKIRVEAEEVAKYYEFHKEEFMTPLLLRASHILLKTEEEALSVKAALDSGADFEEMARQKSLDATAIRGGDLGIFQKGQFVPEFEEAVFRMSKGEVSQPVKTPFGYHIIKLSDRMEQRLRDLKTVRNIVEERLFREKRSKALKALVEKLRGNIKIDIDESALDLVTAKPDAPSEGGSLPNRQAGASGGKDGI